MVGRLLRMTGTVLVITVAFVTPVLATSTPAAAAGAPGSWQTEKVFTPPASVEEFGGISCPSPSVCVAVGETGPTTGAAASTTDGGATWTSQSLPSGVEGLSTVSCASTLVCEAMGSTNASPSTPFMVGTTDGGATWQSQSLPAGLTTASTTLFQISCPTTSACIGVDNSVSGAEIFATTDGGATWTSQTPPSGLSALFSLSCLSATTCTAVGATTSSSAAIVSTSDGGATWSSETPPSVLSALISVSCTSATVCTSVGRTTSNAPSIIATTDGGVSWAAETVPAGVEAMTRVACASASACTALGTGPNNGQGPSIAMGTSDGGSTWVLESIPVGDGLSGVSCPAVGTCTAVGAMFPSGPAIIIGQAPTTVLGIPSNGATVSEDTWLDAGASSPVGIASVTFEASGGPNSISDQVVGSGTGTYYGYIGGWDTRDVPNGTYTLQSVATDTTGVSTAGAPITVTVDNPPLSTTVIIPSSGFTLNTAQTYVLDAIASAGATAVSFVVTVPGFITETIPATPTIYGWIAEPGGGVSGTPGSLSATIQSVATFADGSSVTSPAISGTVIVYVNGP